MRSCSSSVLVQETAEQVMPLYAGSVILSDDPEASGRIWRLQSERAMRTVLENVHYNATVRAHEGQEAGLIGFPIFVGLSVGADGSIFFRRSHYDFEGSGVPPEIG